MIKRSPMLIEHMGIEVNAQNMNRPEDGSAPSPTPFSSMRECCKISLIEEIRFKDFIKFFCNEDEGERERDGEGPVEVSPEERSWR